MEHLHEMGKYKGAVLTICGLKFMKFCKNVGNLSSFNDVFRWFISRFVSLLRYSPLSLEIVEKKTESRWFRPQLFSGRTLKF